MQFEMQLGDTRGENGFESSYNHKTTTVICMSCNLWAHSKVGQKHTHLHTSKMQKGKKLWDSQLVGEALADAEFLTWFANCRAEVRAFWVGEKHFILKH